MHARRRVVTVASLVLTAVFVSACGHGHTRSFQGYAEGDFLYIGPETGGRLAALRVDKGDTVAAGQVLFTLDTVRETAALREAEARVAAADARLADAREGRRPSEIAALEARLREAGAEAAYREREAERTAKLRAENVVSVDADQQARAQADAARAAVDALTAELETARLGAREDLVRAAEAESAAAAAAETQAQWLLDQRTVKAEQGGTVEDVLYRPGEWVAPGLPVVVLLPPENLKIRFFVPEVLRAKIRVGETVNVHVDGKPEPFDAVVAFLAGEAEFTQPFIYSRETREKLVYMVEARVPAAMTGVLRPGQPVDVSLP